MTRSQYLALAWWKLRQKGRQLRDGHLSLLQRRADRWAQGWSRTADWPGSLACWLDRAGGGTFWLPLEEADEWARAGWTDEDERREILRWLLWDNHKLTSYTATERFMRHFRGNHEVRLGALCLFRVRGRHY